MSDAPSVSPSALSGANVSLNSSFASRPMRKSAPAQKPTQPSPVASTKSGAANRTARLRARSSAFTAAMPPSARFSTPTARVERRTSRLGVSRTIRIRRASESAVAAARFMNVPRSSRTRS